MESTIQSLLSELESGHIQNLYIKAIQNNNLDQVKMLLENTKLDIDKVDCTNLSKEMTELISDHKKAIKDKVIDILLTKYQTLDHLALENRKDLLMYEFYNEISCYKKPQCLIYPINGNDKPTPRDGLRDEKYFTFYFNQSTNNIFDNMNWTNLVIAGGFIAGLTRNDSRSNSMFINTDIDLYIYGPTESEIQNKYLYLFGFLSKHNPIYTMSKSLVHIIIPGLKHIIQLIPSIGKTPIDIINDFDFNYVAMYYDGSDVHTTIRGLVAQKYNLATYNIGAHTGNIDARIHKTIRKGFDIQYNPNLKSLASIVTDDYIDISSLEQDLAKSTKFTDNQFILESLSKINPDKHSEFIKLMIDSDSVTKNSPSISSIQIKNFNFGSYCESSVRDLFRITHANDFVINSITLDRKIGPYGITIYQHLVNDRRFELVVRIPVYKNSMNDKTVYPDHSVINVRIDSTTKAILDAYQRHMAPKLNTNAITMHKSDGTIDVHFKKTNTNTYGLSHWDVRMKLYYWNDKYAIKYSC